MADVVWFCPLCQTEGVEPDTVFCSNDGARVRPIAERGSEWIGKVLKDRYRVVRFIDSGGTAEVYEAERLNNGKRVALKLLHEEVAQRAQATDDFLKEAQLVSRIAHPNIVAIEDFGTLPGDIHYMVMELLEGTPLSVELERGQLPVMTALKYAMQACEGLAAAHARDVLHCDIKPANIFLQRVAGQLEPVVKILDLGIGRMFHGGAAEHATAGIVSGTPEYMSPEQARGQALRPQADIYSMGCAVYEMLLGEVPFADESYVKVLDMHLKQKPSWPDDLAAARGIPAGAREVVLKALEKDPAARQPSMLDFQQELGAVARQVRARTNIPAPPPVPSIKVPSSVRSGPRGKSSVPPVSQRGDGPGSSPPSTLRRVSVTKSTGAAGEIVEIAADVFWVGRRRGQLLENNSYLRVFRGNGTEITVLVSPGPPEDLAVTSAKVAAILGPDRRVDHVFLAHQGPDIASNGGALQQTSRQTRVVCSEDTFGLARYYGLDARRFLSVESLPQGRWTLPTGHTLEFVPAQFCPVRGATMLYDPASQVLFSGSLFGGARVTELVANERARSGVEMYHQIFMPSRAALERACALVHLLDPAPAVLAPQHGAVVVGVDAARAAIQLVANLEVGLDLLEAPADDGRCVRAANDLLREYAELAGHEKGRALVASFSEDLSFARVLLVDAHGEIEGFKVTPRLALEALAQDALASLPAERRGDLRRSVQVIWKQHELDHSPVGFPSSGVRTARSGT